MPLGSRRPAQVTRDFVAAVAKKVLHPAGDAPAVANLASQVGAVRSVGNA